MKASSELLLRFDPTSTLSYMDLSLIETSSRTEFTTLALRAGVSGIVCNNTTFVCLVAEGNNLKYMRRELQKHATINYGSNTNCMREILFQTIT
eukprot:313264-Amphidinium_carterae.1